MSLFNIMAVSASALEAQSVRLNTISSNLANSQVVSSTPEGAYQARYPVFQTMLQDSFGGSDGEAAGVRVAEIYQSQLPPRQEFSPSHPLANEEGYIYRSNINPVDEMANMISASRSYQSSIEAMNTAKQLIQRTITLGR
ncbi:MULTISPECIES: flagellar basal body rod protein FlgC [Haliea]|jgi:flagellar basal-body rod protein FlgC|uniref:flagellar basal body rod protein FlgC n=1 Tax=Haliea TaxID=475794 RepID=UPI0003F6AB83|nr:MULTISPECIES: flagellar basal body rod protein FlgC [Haliea]MAY91435.1 flagellar basal body rod protein FlgC [Haliea sp.]MBK41031.1 flagellar basal body rod protein FlgC [Haliea sp.]MBP71051.1 flagellar basal body rod protein FlgC [Haliea sp.]HCD56921.1 flagellar basal body rod protein FlgC [Halieaceae bacterium]|tara:strand:+ start:4667 stop:5086 length:420 start_codon:yes stop_codon:yes gene_type:complete